MCVNGQLVVRMSKEGSKGENGIIKKVADFCWSNNFLGEPFLSLLSARCPTLPSSLDVFRKFFKDHAEEFADAPPLMQGGEHNLVYYSLFQEYLGIYEVSPSLCLSICLCLSPLHRLTVLPPGDLDSLSRDFRLFD
jgi:hypothetical protein